MTTELQGNAAKVGLRISAEKTKAMAVENTQTISLSVKHKDIEFVEHFQYLGSNISARHRHAITANSEPYLASASL